MLTTQEIDALLNASREADEGPTMLVRRVEAAVEAAERERWKEAAMLTGDALRELERYEYAAATIGLRKAVASMGPNVGAKLPHAEQPAPERADVGKGSKHTGCHR